MLFSEEAVHKAARERRVRPEFIEKAARLLNLLKLVDDHPYLGPRALLRGGTAINVFLADAPRLSVDADLVYVGQEGRDAMLEERREVEERLLQVARSQGYAPGDWSKAHASGTCLLTYTNMHGQKDSIKVDVNYMFRVALLPAERSPAARIVPDLEVEFNLMHPDEIYAGKVKAMIDRAHPRDLFDVWRLIEGGSLSAGGRIGDLATFHLATHEEDVRRWTPARIAWPDRRKLDGELAYLVPKGDCPSPSALRKAVGPFVESILDWRGKRKSFLDAVQSGESRGELLAPDDPDMASRINRHPALLWKLQGIRRRPGC